MIGSIQLTFSYRLSRERAQEEAGSATDSQSTSETGEVARNGKVVPELAVSIAQSKV